MTRSFRDTFTVLEERAVLDRDLAARLRDLAGLRNRLVHLYATIDDSLIHGFLAEGIVDLDRFARRVAQTAARLAPGDSGDTDAPG